jgi:acetyltransferase-like isoleucine patch superfamily enzyme
MKRLLKRAFSAVLIAVLRPAGSALDGIVRLWAFARLAARLKSPVHPSVVVLGTPEVQGSANITLGRDLMLYRELYLETQSQGRIQIGDGVVISRGTHIVSFCSVTIGAGTMIGEYASIRDANHAYGNQSIRNSGHTGAPITIGRNAWIGRGAAILAGVSIGENAVVGANAVVTHNLAANTVVAGVPAREIQRKVVA